MGLKAEPTNAAPADMETATIGVKPIRVVRMRSTGISGMISSCMFSTTPPMPKASETKGTTRRSRPWRRRMSHETVRRSVPLSSTTVKAPPMRKTRKMTWAASAIPRGKATTALNRLTGVRSTLWYVPATTTVWSVTSSSWRSYSPAGRT
jgi:hypothetical protein